MAKKKKEKDEETLEQKTVDFLSAVQKDLKKAVDADKHNINAALEDLRFAQGEDVWDAREVQERDMDGRPHLQIDLIAQYVSRQVGEERQNKPRIDVKPIDGRATVHGAQIRKGIIANIEYLSSADRIYSQAYEQMLEGAFGAWRINTRYCEENPFVQEAYLESIPNPFACHLDPGKNREYGFILERMSRSDFEDAYPDATTGGDEFQAGQGMSGELYYDKNFVVVAEYFKKQYKTVPMVQLEDGSVMTREEADKLIKDWEEENDKRISQAQAKLAMVPENPAPVQPAPAAPPVPPQPQMPMASPAGGLPAPAPAAVPPQPPIPPKPPVPMMAPQMRPKPRVVKERNTKIAHIKHWVLTAGEILEGGLEGEDFPGKHIPIIQIKGRERNIEGKTYVRSFIRPAKDPIRLHNYFTTMLAETTALAPKAPWLATPKMVEGHEAEYAKSGQKNYPILFYEIDPEAPQGARPERIPSANPPVAIFQQITESKQSIKDCMGIHGPDLGSEGPERTGEAIRLRRQPGDVGAFPFFDNLLRGIEDTGRILNDIIPEIYDTERDVRIRNFDGTEGFMPINTTAKKALEQATSNPERYHGLDVERIKKQITKEGPDSLFNKIKVGKYDTVVVAGPSYATQREESNDKMMRIFQAAPKQMSVGLDILVENSDFKDADRLARRIRKSLPPNIVEQRPDEPPSPPPPVPPQMQLMMMKARTEEAKQKKELMKLEVEKLRLMKELQETKGGMRREAIEVLAELHAPQHPADFGVMPE